MSPSSSSSRVWFIVMAMRLSALATVLSPIKGDFTVSGGPILARRQDAKPGRRAAWAGLGGAGPLAAHAETPRPCCASSRPPSPTSSRRVIGERFGGRARARSLEMPPRRELGDLAAPAGPAPGPELEAQAARHRRGARRGPRPARPASSGSRSRAPATSTSSSTGGRSPPRLLGRSAGRPIGRARAGKIIVEHTNINPNKAAHIGHLRNAVLGDVLVARPARARPPGRGPELHRRHRRAGRRRGGRLPRPARPVARPRSRRSPSRSTTTAGTSTRGRPLVRGGPGAPGAAPRDPARARERRGRARRAGPAGGAADRRAATSPPWRGSASATTCSPTRATSSASTSSTTAFERLKESGAVRLETEGKNAGCWVMPLAESEEFAGLEDPDKVIVRSDGTVTYVGKDIAYQLWKFGLLGADFGTAAGTRRGSGRPPARAASRAPALRRRRRGCSTSSTRARATSRRSCAPASRRSATPSEARALGPLRLRDGGALAGHGAPARLPRRGRGRGEGKRAGDVGPQGDRRQGRRPARPARGQEPRGDRRAQPRAAGTTSSTRLAPPDRHRRAALLHGQGRPPSGSSPSTSTRRSTSRASPGPTSSTRWCAPRTSGASSRRPGSPAP